MTTATTARPLALLLPLALGLAACGEDPAADAASASEAVTATDADRKSVV